MEALNDYQGPMLGRLQLDFLSRVGAYGVVPHVSGRSNATIRLKYGSNDIGYINGSTIDQPSVFGIHFSADLGGADHCPEAQLPSFEKRMRSMFGGCDWMAWQRHRNTAGVRVYAVVLDPEMAVRYVLHAIGKSTSSDAYSDIEADRARLDALAPTERQALVESRMGQGIFRQRLIERWRSCAVTECDLVTMLRASHIKPWRVATNPERLDVFNGLLLIPNLDVAFDLGFMSFDEEGLMTISPSVSTEQRRALRLEAGMRLRKPLGRGAAFMRHRRDFVFRQ